MNAKRITLATLPQATAQEVFDQVARHLLTQKKQSRRWWPDIGDGCSYRGANGRSCAAGCLIGDEEYQVEMEGVSWHGLAADLGIVPVVHAKLIGELQAIHDIYMPSKWSARLRQFAKQHALSPAVIEEFSAKENA